MDWNLASIFAIQTCRLLSTPLEIQNIIFSMVLLGHQPVVIGSAGSSEPGLLASCRYVRRQYLELYYTRSTFEFQSLQGAKSADQERIAASSKRWIKTCPSDGLKHIKQIRFAHIIETRVERNWTVYLELSVNSSRKHYASVKLLRSYGDDGVKYLGIAQLQNEAMALWCRDVMDLLLVALQLATLLMMLLWLQLQPNTEFTRPKLWALLNSVWHNKTSAQTAKEDW